MSVDQHRGIVFAPLAWTKKGSGHPGDQLFASCLVALDARSGKRLWHFQAIRRDVWDWDLPAPPALVRVERAGKQIDAVAQVSKVGFVYVLDRVTGRSLFPLTERSAFASDAQGILTATTQLQPELPLPIVRQHVTRDLLTRRSSGAAVLVRERFSALRSRGLWDPPSEQGTVVLPGIGGGGGVGWSSLRP